MLAGNIRDMYRTEGETGDGKEPVFGKNPLREQKIKYFYLPKQSRHNDNTHTHTHTVQKFRVFKIFFFERH